MTRRKRPMVNLEPVASHYQAANERIMEVSGSAGGCLFSIVDRDGMLIIEAYRADCPVIVKGSTA